MCCINHTLPEFYTEQEALRATYLTRQLGASGQIKMRLSVGKTDGCRKITVPLNVSLNKPS